MKVALFIPCYIDQFYPQVGLDTVRVLRHFGINPDFPIDQTCCGQPMANTGCTEQTRPLAERFVRIFRGYDYVVAPSGSCVAMVRHHYREYFDGSAEFDHVKNTTFELCEFLTDVLKVEPLQGRFDHIVGIHQSCHGLRELRMGSSSEIVGRSFSKVRSLLEQMQGIRFAELQRADECCGFGGTFAVNEESVSCMMGEDRVHDHEQAGTEVLTAADMSCLMHLDGLIRRDRKPIRVLHVAEILAAAIDAQQESTDDRPLPVAEGRTS